MASHRDALTASFGPTLRSPLKPSPTEARLWQRYDQLKAQAAARLKQQEEAELLAHFGDLEAKTTPAEASPAQRLVNEVVAGLAQPPTAEQVERLAAYRHGLSGVGDNPLAALAGQPGKVVRDFALRTHYLLPHPLNIASWFSDKPLPGTAEHLRQTILAEETRDLPPEALGRRAGFEELGNAAELGVGVAYLPGIANLVKGLGRAGLGAATQGLRAGHQALRRARVPRLEAPALNASLSPYSGYTYDPGRARQLGALSAALGAATTAVPEDAYGGGSRVKVWSAEPPLDE